MTAPDADVMDALMALDAGDDVTLTVADENGEERELDAHVTDTYRHEPEREGGVYVPGQLDIHMDATDDAVDSHGLGSHSLALHAKDHRPGRWKQAELTVWDPATDDEGFIIRDEYTDLGTITAVGEPPEGGEDERSE